MDINAKIKYITFALVLFIIGIFILIFSVIYINNELVELILNSLSISIVTTALFSIILNIFTKDYFENAFKDLISKELPFLHRSSQIGLVEFANTFPIKDNIYEIDFIKSSKITIVMNDAKRFYDNNITLFRSRFKQRKKTTNIILLDPEAKDSISVLTRKNRYEENYFKVKINKVLSELITEQNKYGKDRIKIYLHDLYNTMAVVLTNKYAMVSLYRNSPGKDDVPHFIFEKTQSNNCEYLKVEEDIRKLIDYSREINDKDIIEGHSKQTIDNDNI